MANAHYIKHPNPMHRGNPLVEGLGFPLSKHKLQQQCKVPFKGGLDLSGVPAELHGYYTRSSILNLFSLHVTQDEFFEVYENIRLAIECAYIGRNPLRPDWQRTLAAVERDKDQPLKSQSIRRLNLLESSYTYLISGLSGRGKSSMVKRALSFIEQELVHTQYETADGELVPCNLKQVTYLYVEHHDRKGQKAFLLDILVAIDEATGESYAYQHRNSNVKDLINAVRKCIIIHHIGCLIIDEAQNFSRTSSDLKIGTNEKTSMKFVEELVNVLGVSTIFVGTFSALKLFTQEMTVTRRTIRAGSLNLASCPVDSPFWKNLCHNLVTAIDLPGGRDNDDMLCLKLHELSAGIPAIASSVTQATLRFLSYCDPERQKLTLEALDYVYSQQFAPLSGPVNALLHGDYHKYEDLKAMELLEVINGDPEGEALSNMKDVERQSEALAEAYKQQYTIKEGQVKVMPAKPPRSAHEVDASKESEQLSPDNFMEMLGGDQ
ncbi:ATP-binding protein [Corallincola holothuriorum]|uniref:ATP-binding protein n=1 Tax=Corallincola holothuriorum TaxID=2282215 RepID=A0A368N6P3_9GAMM|nr:ATP-binding protein [Corallincola holothuriorum]RCU45683.1 ATP-binding protein [Corallincola holothuriorum]